jgi:hypothetical protein
MAATNEFSAFGNGSCNIACPGNAAKIGKGIAHHSHAHPRGGEFDFGHTLSFVREESRMAL